MATDLQVTASSPPAPCLLLSQTGKLEKLVDELHPHMQRLATPDERASLAALIPAYEAAIVRADPDTVVAEVATLSLAYPAARITPEEMEARLELYATGLAHLPADVLTKACQAAMRTTKFFPSIAEILAHAGEAAVRAWRLQRIKHLIAKHDAEYRAPEAEEPLTAAEQAEMEALRRKFGLAA